MGDLKIRRAARAPRMPTYTISQRAFYTVLFHAYKYPSSATNGVLLASASTKTDQVEITAAVPLFHSLLSLAPMTEVALMLVDKYCEKHKLVVVGYYQANELLERMDTEITRSASMTTAKRVADKIAEYYSHACILFIRNQNFCEAKMFQQSAVNELMALFTQSNGEWTQNSAGLKLTDTDVKRELLTPYFEKPSVKLIDLVDFENHKDNPTTKWLDSHFLKELPA